MQDRGGLIKTVITDALSMEYLNHDNQFDEHDL